MGFARKVANRVIFMDEGKIIEDTNKDDFFNNPQPASGQPGPPFSGAKDPVQKISAKFLRGSLWRGQPVKSPIA
jgi:energy-coupling factor transporter ATP-binding protein EcfA2